MPSFKDLTGQKFHRLTALSQAQNSKSNQTQWLCLCECGKKVVVRSASLINGHTKSCGCYNNEVREKNTDQTTHGLSHTRLYNIWNGIRQRCYNPNSKIYKHYGGKGVGLCNEWFDFKTFYDWSMEHGYRDDLSIDRIDFNGNYEPSNCRWVDRYVQMNNTGANIFYMFNGERLTIPQIERQLGFAKGTLWQRVTKLGIPLEIAVKYPAHQLPPKKEWVLETSMGV